MIYRILYYVCSLTAIVLFGVAFYAYYLETAAPGAIIDEPDREFSNLAVGKNAVTYRLHNPTGHTVRVIGCSFC